MDEKLQFQIFQVKTKKTEVKTMPTEYGLVNLCLADLCLVDLSLANLSLEKLAQQTIFGLVTDFQAYSGSGQF